MESGQATVWSVAIFAARESLLTLEQTTIAAVKAAIQPTTIDVLINGNEKLAHEAVPFIRSIQSKTANPGVTIRLWFVPVGDKAHTFNQYLKYIWPNSTLAFFVDGYVRINADALICLDLAMSASPKCLAGTGVPTVGRSAKSLRDEMLKDGGIHGNFYALKASTIEALKAVDFKLPLGLYRTDPTLGAALSFGLNPSLYSWNPKERILVHPDVTWVTDEKSCWNPSDVLAQLKRTLRQGQGILENLAVRDHFAIQKNVLGQLPGTTADLVLEWAKSHPSDLLKIRFRHPLLIGLALKKMRRTGEWLRPGTLPEPQIWASSSTKY